MSSTGPRFRTPAEIRAIPNAKWEQWLRTNSVPFHAFAAERRCQTVLRTLVKATLRRVA